MYLCLESKPAPHVIRRASAICSASILRRPSEFR